MASDALFDAGLGALRVVVALLALTPLADAVHVQGAGVAGSSSSPARYVMAGQPVALECRFSLDADEVLQGVTWTKDAHLVYRWLPGGRVSAFGPLENATAPATPGWNVHIVGAAVPMAGNYSCSVHTDRGSAASRRFQLPVLLVCKARIETEDSTSFNCTVGWRLSCARVFPDLNLTAGVFDPDENKYIDRVTEWTKVVYSDNTFGYHAFKSYHIADIPKSSIFLWSLSYTDQVPLVAGNVSSGAVHRSRSGCPEPPALPPSEHLRGQLQVQLQYDDDDDGLSRPDCRGQPRGASRAIYSCASRAANDVLGQDHENEHDPPDGQGVKELVCANGGWVEADTNAPWPSC